MATDRTTVSVRSWLLARAPLWQSLSGEVKKAVGRTQATPEEALQTLQAYRALTRDLSSAREMLPGDAATAALERAVAQLHVAVNRTPRHGMGRWRTLFQERIPEAARQVRIWTFWIALLMVATTFAGWWLISTYPELISLIASEKMIDAVQHGRLWTADIFNVTPSSVMSLRIFSNNVVVTLGAFCAGLLFGLGTFYMVAINGLMLGGLLAYTHQYGMDGQLLKFIIAHGPVELSVICLAGATGTALGESLIRPTEPTRAESFRRCAERLGPLLLAGAILLLGSGLIEGFISPDPRFSIQVRLVVGLGYWVLMLLFLSGRLYPRPKATSL